MRLIINGREISPCIQAKAKYALGISNYRPRNIKTCSREYWIKVLLSFVSKYNLSSETLQRAIDRKDLYRNQV
jgi:hypothetical protein